MCCCGLEVSRRQWLCASLAASAAALLTPFTGRAQDDPAVQAVLSKTISFDAHVGIGTDQQTAPGAVQNYGLLPQLTASMLKKGFTPEEASKILGGNLVRVFARATGAA